MTVDSLSSTQCCGCAACLDKCPVHAIAMIDDNAGNRRASVDMQTCIKCGACVKVCPQFNKLNTPSYERTSYVCHYNNKEYSEKSSSGGVFMALAQHVIHHGGVVYGAAMIFERHTLLCKHVRVDNLKDLQQLQGSKYVQSITDGIYIQVKKDLSEGKLVLFSGTSCQVASLKCFVGNYENLMCIDIVCHGVPQHRLFLDYLTFLEKSYKCKVVDMTFRSKGILHRGKEKRFLLTIFCQDSNCQTFTKTLYSNQSAYYKMFLNRAGYRAACYHCVYATLQKPGDITLGDFMPRRLEFKQYGFSPDEHESSVIVHTEKGASWLRLIMDEVTIVPIPIDIMIKHHPNLSSPSISTVSGEKMYKSYLLGGFSCLQKQVSIDYYRTQFTFFLERILTLIFKFQIRK